MLFSGGCRFSAGQCTSNQHLSKKDASFLLSLKPQLLIHLGKKWGHFTAFASELDVRVCISSPKSGLTLPAFFCLVLMTASSWRICCSQNQKANSRLEWIKATVELWRNSQSEVWWSVRCRHWETLPSSTPWGPAQPRVYLPRNSSYGGWPFGIPKCAFETQIHTPRVYLGHHDFHVVHMSGALHMPTHPRLSITAL